MNLDEFTKILIGSNSAVPEQKQCHDILMQFREQNYAQYISFMLMILQNPTDSNLSMLAIAIIFNEIKSGKVFENQELENSFLQLFLQIVPNILASPIFLDNIKIIVSSTLSLIAINRYNNTSDATIQKYILQLFQSNPVEYETIVINCIMEIFMSCEGLAGFPSEIISNFLIMPLQKESSYIPRCKLFFSVVMRSPNDQNLSKLFEAQYLRTPIPNNLLHDFLNIVIAFAEKHSEFFNLHLNTFIPMLCQISIDPQNENRNMALYAFGAINQGSPKMCQSVPEFYIPVTECLIRIMSEVNANTPIEYDPNSSESCLIARDVLRSIAESCDNEHYYKCIEAIYHQTLKKAAEASNLGDNLNQALLQVPWPFIHAIVSAYSDIQLPPSFYFTVDISGKHDCSSFIQFIQRFIPLLQSKQTPPILRIEILNLFSVISNVPNLVLQMAGFLLLPILKDLVINDENPKIKLESARTLKLLFNQGSMTTLNQSLMNFFPSHFEEIIAILAVSPAYVAKQLVKCLTYFSLIGQPFLPYFERYLTVLMNIYKTQNNDLNLMLEIIYLISLVCRNLSIPIDKVSFIFNGFLSDLAQIRQVHQIDEFSDDKFFKSIKMMLNYLSANAAQFALTLLPKALEKANDEIQIMQVPKLNKMEQISLFIEIQETSISSRNYALKSDIEAVCRGLEMLQYILKCIGTNIRPFMQDFLAVNQKWILNQFQIEQVKSVAWFNINTLISLFKDQPEITALLNIFFDDLNQTICSSTINTSIVVIREMTDVLSIAKETYNDMQRISNALVNLDLFLDKLLVEVREEADNSDRFQCSHDTKEDGNYDLYLSFVATIFKLFLKLYPEITIAFMRNNFIQKLTNLITSSKVSYLIVFAIEVNTNYFCKENNLQDAINWIMILFQIGQKCQEDASFKAFQYLIPLFQTFSLPIEFCRQFQDAYEDFLEELDSLISNDSNYEDKYRYCDWALCAFAVFIQTQQNNIDKESAIHVFCEIFPFSDDNEISDYAFAFAVELASQRNPEVFSDDNFFRIMDSLTSQVENQILMKPETLLSLKQFLMNIVRDPVYGPSVMAIIRNDEMKHNETNIEIMNYGQSVLVQNQLVNQ